MHALVHLSGPVLPRFCCWLHIHQSMKCVKTIFTTDIVNIFYSYTLLLQMCSLCQQHFDKYFNIEVGFWGQITTLKLIHICCQSIQGHNIIRCKAFSNTIHNFCVGNITKSETNCLWRWQWYQFVLSLSTADAEEVIYDKVGRTPQILNEK
jgi:hypothetical protein